MTDWSGPKVELGVASKKEQPCCLKGTLGLHFTPIKFAALGPAFQVTTVVGTRGATRTSVSGGKISARPSLSVRPSFRPSVRPSLLDPVVDSSVFLPHCGLGIIRRRLREYERGEQTSTCRLFDDHTTPSRNQLPPNPEAYGAHPRVAKYQR